MDFPTGGAGQAIPAMQGAGQAIPAMQGAGQAIPAMQGAARVTRIDPASRPAP